MHKKTYTQMLIAVLFIRAQTLKQPRCPLKKWTLKQSMTHPHHGILLRTKKEQTLDIYNNLDEYPGNFTEWIKQSQKITYCLISRIQHSWNDNIIDEKNRLVVARGKGKSKGMRELNVKNPFQKVRKNKDILRQVKTGDLLPADIHFKKYLKKLFR